MSLQAKILLIVLAVVSLYAVSDYASQRSLVLPSFIALERNEAQKSMRRCIGLLEDEIDRLDMLARTWTVCEYVYQFVEDQSENHISSYLDTNSLAGHNLNFIYICDAKGRGVWKKTRGLKTNKTIEDKLTNSSSSDTTHLLIHKNPESFTKGILITKQGAILVASRPIITNKNKESISGTIIVGRLFDNELDDMLTEESAVELKVWAIANDLIPTKEKEVLDCINTTSQFHIRTTSDKLLQVYTLFPDIQGNPSILLRANIPRDIITKGTELIQSNLFSILAAGLFVLLVLMISLRRTVVVPIKRLTKHIINIGRGHHNVPLQTSMRRKDEIGTLAREFSHMVEQLTEARKKLLEQSYYSGMAEVASGILHNARNVLTPMVSNIDGLRQRLRQTPLERMEQAQTELAEGTAPDKRRNDLNQFINMANKNLIELVRETENKLNNVAEQIAQIEQILSEQSKLSYKHHPSEKIKLDKLMQEVTDLLSDDVHNSITIEIDPGIKSIEPVMARSITLFQVFNNILVNAIESIQTAAPVHGRINITAKADKVDGANMAHIEISDNGQGIDKNDLGQIFERGFSTKKTSSSGIGLHWCANIIAAMNGRIYAESQGKGYGASFHILLPVSQQRVPDEQIEVKI